MNTIKNNIFFSDWVIGGTLLLTIIWNGVCALFAPGWIAASIIVAINWTIFIFYVFSSRDYLVTRIVLLAIIAGFVELFADWWLVEITKTLVYHSGGGFIASSPFYMPFAWGVVLTQTAYIGWRISKKLGIMSAILFTGILGASTIPFYEWWANGAMWWYYQNCNMLGVVPYYIIMGEFLIASGLIFIISLLETRSWLFVVALGIVQGLWIWLSYFIAFYLLNILLYQS